MFYSSTAVYKAEETKISTVETGTHSGGFDAKLSLPVYQAVLNGCKQAGISIRSTDTDYGCSQVHVLEHGLLQADTHTHITSNFYTHSELLFRVDDKNCEHQSN